MKNFKPLVSSAPTHSILNARTFHYSSSADTDIRRTFARLRREAALHESQPRAATSGPVLAFRRT
jgi:hypothetical protein